MKILKNKLKNELNIRTEKDYPIKGIEFIDMTPLIMQKETLKEILDQFEERLKNKEIDYVVAPDGRGCLRGTAIAARVELGWSPGSA